MNETALLTGVALARLTVSYGMTDLGAGQLLADARTSDDGTADTLAVRVKISSRYPETFTITQAGES